MKRHIIIAAIVFVFASLGAASAQWQAPVFQSPQFRPVVIQPLQFQQPVFQGPQFQQSQFQVVRFQNQQFQRPGQTLPVRPVVERFQTPQFQVSSGVRPNPSYGVRPRR